MPVLFLALAGLIATAASLPFLAIDGRSQSRLTFVAEIAATEAGRAEVFFDVGEHFNARDAVSVTLDGEGRFVTCRFPLPDLGLKQLRFDPTSAGGRVEVRDPRFETAGGRVLHRLEPADFRPVQHIRTVEPRPDGFAVLIEPGQSDPIMLVELDATARLGIGRVSPALRHVLRGLAFFGGLVAAGAMLHLGWQRIGEPLGRQIRRRPVASLAVISAAAVVIQCHPVIFFGKSFVSPDIGTYLLYEGFPTLPGYESEPLEDAKGSDTGAIYYFHLHQPKLTRDALFRDGELPLWNRYMMCGVPALGQGQSMLGEPLSLPAVLAGGEAWAWDLRFLVARWLYAFGAGVAVWLLTRHHMSAGIIAGTAVFIGYFGFRLNHPAQFSLAAAPWIIVAWLAVRNATTSRQLAVRGLGLCLATWCVHVSGTVKEAAILMAGLNLTGALLVALDAAPARLRLQRLAWAAFWGVVYVLVTAPVWMTFLGTLDRASSVHQVAAVSQSRPWLLAGYFEDMLIRARWPGEPQAMPAANLVVLLGIAWAVVRMRESVRHCGMRALGLGFLGAAAFAYGLVPGSWIMRVPLLANIQHVDNTFSCVMIVIGTILAGGGIHILVSRLAQAGWMRDAALCAAFAGLLGGLYAALGAPESFSPFARAYLPSLVIAFVAVLLAVGASRLRRSPGALAALLAGAAVVMLWRHGTYLRTPFDAYVVNPKVRASFHAASPAVAFVSARMDEPSRPNGLRYALFSGFNAMLGWEGIYGVDPMRNRAFDELARAGGVLKLFWGLGVGDWSQWNEDRAERLQPVLDALNVRYYLAPPGTPAERMRGLAHRFSGDLDVYESESAWPRAFFSRTLWTYPTVDAFVARLTSGPDRTPFAAVQASDVAGLELPTGVLGGAGGAASHRPADDYRLTTNTTTFHVSADGPGVVVLTEGYFPLDFRVHLNGERVPYFRANHAFKGVVIPAAGEYEVRFEYWPREMSIALVLAAVGLALACAGGAWAWRRKSAPPIDGIGP